jgi:hypothetical protein
LIVDDWKGDYSTNSIKPKFLSTVFIGKIVKVSSIAISEGNEEGIYSVKSTSSILTDALLS